ncbi:WecB/TagA/CpsF family glycosyltransferase [Williamsia muralis]|uniref:Glycosyltransferase n=1 Tax=Williamsia marianensis TaxID=85044 RepID=A0A2G3PI35_WILMA|nr:WecB/TagA/CpsF family glycosyltransferase [Williamsia marianensis]PHV65366.1 hypothetical protein CSW57_16410 [Williamsia marianensis]
MLREIRDQSKSATHMKVGHGGEVSIDGEMLFSAGEDQLVDELKRLIETQERHLVTTCNVDQIVKLRKSADARSAFEASSIRTLDGAPLVLLARLLGARPCERNTGADMLTRCAALSGTEGWSIAIVGGAGDVGAQAARNLRVTYPGARVNHVPLGRLENVRSEKSKPALAQLKDLQPDITFVCLGFPKQEAWVQYWLSELPPSVYIGAGAAADFAAGSKARAPVFLQKLSLEWAFRLYQEPRRLFKRYMIDDIQFVSIVLRSIVNAVWLRSATWLLRSPGASWARRFRGKPEARKENMTKERPHPRLAIAKNQGAPSTVDRLIIHQFDLLKASPGGIDTCIRGLLKYLPVKTSIAIVGVIAMGSTSERQLGVWETHRIEGRIIYFLPVARLDPADQHRRVPHSLRIASGLLRYRSRLPIPSIVQVHRADLAAFVIAMRLAPLAYFVHTQENGLTGGNSDSVWRKVGGAHRQMERRVVRHSATVTVFNEDHAKALKQLNAATIFSPTWFDPEILSSAQKSDTRTVIWAGRLETPKDPALAINAVAQLISQDPGSSWRLDMYGFGTQADALQELVAGFAPFVSERITLRGRVDQKELARAMGSASAFVMTSYPGYEGFPRVLVEALASGLPAVVTTGSDTGGLVEDGVNGFTVESRNAAEIASALARTTDIQQEIVAASVAHLAAPAVVDRIYDHTVDSFGANEPVGVNAAGSPQIKEV